MPAGDGDGAAVEGAGAPEGAMHAALDVLAILGLPAHLNDSTIRVVFHGLFTTSFVKFHGTLYQILSLLSIL